MSSRNTVAGNWKMNTSLEEAKALLANLGDAEWNPDTTVIVAPPAPYLAVLAERASDHIGIAAQNCHAQDSGAYTGEWSASMLASAGVKYCILGHSERRAQFGETDALIAEKVNVCLAAGIVPIYCCGEVKEERETGTQNQVVGGQVKAALGHLSAEDMAKVIIAYEPVWAIGTGLTASDEQAQQMHAHIRGLVAELHSMDLAVLIPILYGGSVKPGNAAGLFAQPDVDGGLVGGASLKSADFEAIIQAHG